MIEVNVIIEILFISSHSTLSFFLIFRVPYQKKLKGMKFGTEMEAKSQPSCIESKI